MSVARIIGCLCPCVGESDESKEGYKSINAGKNSVTAMDVSKSPGEEEIDKRIFDAMAHIGGDPAKASCQRKVKKK